MEGFLNLRITQLLSDRLAGPGSPRKAARRQKGNAKKLAGPGDCRRSKSEQEDRKFEKIESQGRVSVCLGVCLHKRVCSGDFDRTSGMEKKTGAHTGLCYPLAMIHWL